MEYNNLTKKLLAEGYTADNHPDYVEVNTSRLPGDNPLHNLVGGFEYKRFYTDKITYVTGCSRLVKGIEVIHNMSFMGEYWCHENDNPVIRCPYDKPECELNDRRLHGLRGGGLCVWCWCVCHRTEEEYDYHNSIEKANADRRMETERKYQEFSDKHNGRVCRNHMGYDERSREWRLNYEPGRCARMCYSQNGYCPILGRKLSKKRGNVYYDLKTSYIRHDGTIFDGEVVTGIKKGIRYFKKPCSMDICEAFVKTEKGEIEQYYRMNNSLNWTFDKSFTFEILNIRAEAKPSRDLMQDLQDIEEGIAITHASDMEKREKEWKKEKRKLAAENKILKLEKKILEVGYYNLDIFSMDKVHADKWLGEERIAELEEIRNKKIEEEQEEPVQLSLFDMMK